jgi:hypothetical protein
LKRFGLGFGAVVVGVVVVGAVLVGVGLQDRRVALSPGPNSFVNADRPGLDAHNSPAVVAHPDRPEVLVVADRIDTPRFSCSVSSVARNGPEYGGSRAQHPTSRPRPASMGSAAERTSGGLEASVTAPP